MYTFRTPSGSVFFFPEFLFGFDYFSYRIVFLTCTAFVHDSARAGFLPPASPFMSCYYASAWWRFFSTHFSFSYLLSLFLINCTSVRRNPPRPCLPLPLLGWSVARVDLCNGFVGRSLFLFFLPVVLMPHSLGHLTFLPPSSKFPVNPVFGTFPNFRPAKFASYSHSFFLH